MKTQKLIPIFVRAHGLFKYDGTPFQGKASPAYNVPNKFTDDDNLVFREAEFSESIIDIVQSKLTEMEYVSERVIPDGDMRDYPLTWQQQKINEIAIRNKGKQILVVAPHSNAQGMGDTWGPAKGMCAFTSRGQTGSDLMAERVLQMFRKEFPDWKFYFDFTDGDSDLEANFAVLVNLGLGVLLEIGFQDNREDVVKLLDPVFRIKIADVIVAWLIDEIKNYN